MTGVQRNAKTMAITTVLKYSIMIITTEALTHIYIHLITHTHIYIYVL